jgi:T5SS/PEP-CTERM-associated repeat protein/autotransporter-associated beta strand protein
LERQSPSLSHSDLAFPAVTGLVQTPIIDVPYSIGSLTFNSDGGNGRFVILGAAELTIGAGGIINNDADIQSVIGPVVLSANQSWNTASGALGMDVVNLNGFNLTLKGISTIGLPSLIVGNGAILMDDYTSTVTMSGGSSNTYNGQTTVRDGTLLLQKTGGAVAVSGDLAIGDVVFDGSAFVRLGGNEQISSAAGVTVDVSFDGGLHLNGFTQTISSLSVHQGVVQTGSSGLLKIGQSIHVGTDGYFNGNITLGDVSASVDSLGLLSTGSSLFVGDDANGSLSIATGGEVINGVTHIAYESGSTGMVTVDGNDSTWTNNGNLRVGYGGTGSLDITAGADVSNTIGEIGVLAGATGVVTVDGLGSTWTNSNALYVGENGSGTLGIFNQGLVTATSISINSNSNMNVSSGGTFDANGTLTIDGGSLNADAGAMVEIGGGTLQNGAQMTIQNGSVLTETSALYLKSGVTMRVNSGATYNTSFTIVGNTPGPPAELIIDGADTLVSSMSCCIDVGYGGAGVMTVTGGARVETPTGAFGSFGPGSVGTVTLDGTDANGIPSSWITAAMNMGLSATSEGTLNIRNGALFRATSMTYGLAVGTPGTGAVFIEGIDMTGYPSLLDAAVLQIGTGGYGNGTGEVTASSGGRINAGNIYLAHTGGSATLTITDLNSKLIQAGAATLTLGHATDGSAVLNVRNNAQCISGTGPIDIYATGQINLESGAVFDAHGPINMQGGEFNFLGGTLHVDTFNGNLLNDAGTLAPGHSVGATAVSGNYTQRDDAALEIEIAGVFPGDWDVLAVEGNASLDGTIEVVLVDSFEPVLGNSFTIVTTDVGNVGGQFDTELFPSFNGLTFDVIYNPNSVVLQVIEATTLPGDFDFDGDVDGRDFLIWQRGGSPSPLSADDLADWQMNYGTGPLGASTAVPEPGTSGVFLAVLLGGILFSRRVQQFSCN